MRKRQEIEEDILRRLQGADSQEAITNHLLIYQKEILLDIRDLLENPLIEINGKDINDKS